MKYSGIGGQAVIEGIMMRNRDRYAVAVRKPDGTIAVDVQTSIPFAERYKIAGLPFIRGSFSFVESMIIGMKTLMYSASFYEEDEEPGPLEGWLMKVFGDRFDKVVMTGALVIAFVMALVIFLWLPLFLSGLLKRFIVSETVQALLEGLLRVAIFILYIRIVSRTEDIRRTFMYHGAEHKCINCIEHGLPLEVDNVAVSSKEHKRCGTSFIIIVMMISILFFMVIRVHHPLLRLLSRLILMPVIAGVSYEFLRLAGRSDNPVINLLSRPGLMMQKLTTYEPDDSMIEVAIRAVEAVFDWQTYEKETFPEGPDETGKVLLTKAAERHAGEVLS
ncbi:MAG: DUF1385 domain-containing protein [Lachnospiraceae bacterium]|nr:DUF1385 domain-containing protein [Lachnospiraceae bacterium]